MSHTPGPWHCHTNGSEFSVTAEDHNGATCYLARIDKFRTRHGDYADEANAKLIAAAPELLEACKALGDYLAFMSSTGNKRYPFKPSPEGVHKLVLLRAAIAKATS